MLNFAHFLTLERPLAVIDLETTGFDPKNDRICQIQITIHYSHRDPIAWGTLVDPECPITNAKESHGITDEAVKGKPSFRQLGPALAPKLTNVDIMGYNVPFDIGFLKEEMKRASVDWPWAGSVIDAYQIYKRKKPQTLGNAYLEYGGEDGSPLPVGSKLEGAHDAGVDVQATEAVLRGLLLRHSDLPRNVKELSAWCFPVKPNAIDARGSFVWVGDEPCISFGKYAKNNGGSPFPMRKIDRGYWKYILDNDFAADCKELAQQAMAGVYPIKG